MWVAITSMIFASAIGFNVLALWLTTGLGRISRKARLTQSGKGIQT
jgi:hypothetical protein